MQTFTTCTVRTNFVYFNMEVFVLLKQHSLKESIYMVIVVYNVLQITFACNF